MADYYVGENGIVRRTKNRKRIDYVVSDDGTVSRITTPTEDKETATTISKKTDTDIAPITTSKKEEEEKEKEGGLDFFQKGSFSDGYQFGDVTKTILGTVGDLGVNFVKGAASLGEGIIDAGSYGVAGVSDFIGADDFAEDVRKKAQKNSVEDFFQPADDYINQYSVLGRTTDSIAQGIGQVGAIILTGGIGAGAGLGSAGVTALTTGVMGVSSAGSGISEAYQDGASDKEATTYGISKGIIDAGTELIFGGLGKAVNAVGLSKGISSLDDVFARTLSNKLSNQVAKNFVEYGVKASAEGFEEVLAGLGTAVAKKITYMDDEELGDILKDENLLEQFVVGMATSGMIQSGLIPGTANGSLKEANESGRDFITGYTENEQAVIDKEVEKRVKEREEQGEKLTSKDKNNIHDEVINALSRGEISIDTIESALGGETFESYRAINEQETALKKEIETLENMPREQITVKQGERLTEARKQLADLEEKSGKTQLKEQLSSEVDAATQNDTFLRESYNEKARRSQAFEADLSKYDEKSRETVKRAVESGILNNTRRTHEMVDLVARLSADKGVLFDFTNNQKLKESGFALEGRTVNGYVKDGTIAVNINSAKALNTVVGHEITHVLEGTELYSELQQAVMQYATTKGEYDARMQELAKLYEGVEGVNIENELTADLVGEYLFTDSDFISNLSTEKPNIFKKIYEEIKYLMKIATAGSKEARELEKVKKAFDKAYKESTNADSTTKYSIKKDANGKVFVDVTDDILNVSDGESVARVIQRVISERFNNLIDANGQKIQINKTTNDEFRRSNSANALMGNPTQAYDDKLRAIANADEILTVARNWVGEERKHIRKDDIVEFARGNVTYRVGENGYVADVVVGIRKNGAAVLYDLVNIYDTKIAEAPVTMANQNDSQRRQDTSAGNNLTESPENVNVKFSLSEDSTGKQLSGEQQQYFKDSKVRDENGRLKVVYHGSTADFSTFSLKYLGTNGTNEGYGFYFTDKKEIAQGYANGTEAQRHQGANGRLFEVYLDIKKPLSDTEVTMSRSDFKKFLIELNKQVDEDGEPLDVLSNYGDVSWEGLNKVVNYAMEIEYDGSDSDVNMIHSIINGTGAMETVFEILRRVTGYDGIVVSEAEWGGDQTIYVAFHPDQIKSVTNKKPTTNPDINLSLSRNSQDIAPTGNFNVYGKDIALEAPTRETVTEAPVKATAEAQETDDYAPIRADQLDELEAQYSERLSTLDEKDMPAEEESTYYDEEGTMQVDDPLADRDIQEVGNRKIKAYMYENPEVKPFFQEEAQNMLYELQNSVKGQRTVDAQLLYESGGEFGVWGTKRETSEQIAYMLDRFKYSYADIEKGLQAIIADHGAENNAVSKRLEFMIDERLREGYSDFMTGYEVPANQDYINLLAEKQISTYSDEAYMQWLETLAQEEAPDYIPDTTETTEDIGPVREDMQPAQTITSHAEDIGPVIGSQRVIDFETGSIVDEPTSEIEIAKQKITKKLALDKQKMHKEFKEKQAQAFEELGEREAYISKKAWELYTELKNLKKGVRASSELGYLLDYGYPWKDVKTALLNTRAKPDRVVNANSGIEAIVREAIGRDYDAKYENIAYMDLEYLEQAKKLESDAASEIEALESGENTSRKTHGEIQRAYVENIRKKFSDAGLDLDTVLEHARDKSTFASVDNTPQRYIEKTLGYKAGQLLNDLTINLEALNESKAIKWLNSFTDRKRGTLAKISKQYGIKPNSKEDAAAQMYGEGFYVNEAGEYITYGDAELARDFPDVKTQQRIKGLAKDARVREIYDRTLEQINESRVRNGYPEIPRRDNYYLHFRAMDDTFSKLGIPFNPNDIRAKDLPTDLAGMTADLKPGQPYFASANRRMGNRTSHSLLGGMERYLTSAKNQIYHIDDIQILRGLRNYVADMYGQAHGLENLDTLTEEEAEARVKEVYDAHLSTFAKFLNEQANVLAGKTSLIDRGLEGVLGRRGITTLNTINTQVAKNMVGFNVSSALTGFVGSVQGLAKANKFDAIKAFSQVVSNRIGSIFGRTDGFAESDPAIARRKGAEKFYRTPYEKVSDAGYTLMSGVDSLTTEFLVRAKYNELTRKGMDSEQAHIRAGEWVMRILGDRSLGQQPQLYNSKMLGLVTKFQLEVRNQLDSMFYDTVQEANVSTEDINNGMARNAKKAAKIASTMVQLAVFQHLFGKAFESVAGYNPTFDIVSVLMTLFGFDDDEEKDDTILDNVEQAFLELLGDLPYTSTFTGGRIPIQSALPIEQLIKGEDSYGNDKSRWETLAETLPYYVMPGGYNQIKKSVQGLGMFDDDLPVSGSYTDSGNLRFPVEDTPLNRAQAAVFGQWASENARDYFDNERQPLKENQIEEFAELDIPIREYWKYREGLKEQDTLEEKFDYIAGLDLPVEKKNIMINNVVDRKEEVDLTGYEDFSGYEEFDFAIKNPEKYEFLQAAGVSYAEYNESEESREAYNWAYKNPEKYVVSKAIGSVVKYRQIASALYDIKADKDSDGKSISGSRKEKVASYINGLDADYGAKIILFKSEYTSDDSYNEDIVDYLNNRDDISYAEMETILKELGFTVDADGTVRW